MVTYTYNHSTQEAKAGWLWAQDRPKLFQRVRGKVRRLYPVNLTHPSHLHRPSPSSRITTHVLALSDEDCYRDHEMPNANWYIYNTTPIPKVQVKERADYFKSQETGISGAKVMLSIYDKEATPMKPQQFGRLSKTWIMTMPVDMPTHRWGKSYKTPPIDEKLQSINSCWEEEIHCSPKMRRSLICCYQTQEVRPKYTNVLSKLYLCVWV